MTSSNFSPKLAALLEGMSYVPNKVGMSQAEIREYQNANGSLFLKSEPTNPEIRREYEIMKWLKDKLPVPKVVHWEEQNGVSHLLMTKMSGVMACHKPKTEIKETVGLLAQGIKMLWSVNIMDCPFDMTLHKKLLLTKENIEAGIVDSANFEEDTVGSPEEIYNQLISTRPAEELCFTHGDYCLPNIFLHTDTVAGFIDLGRAGVADRWQDIALCVRSLNHNFGIKPDDNLYQYFFDCLGVAPDPSKIAYYILLDELF